MELYVTRHGESAWNALRKVCGRTDSPLTEAGHAQARAMAQKAAGFPITRILCSPLTRARQTAEYAAQALGVPLAVEERLIEMDYGAFEGADRLSPAFLEAKGQLALRFPGGESAMDAACRVYGLLRELEGSPERYLLVAHNGICRVLHTYFRDLTNREYLDFSLDNCEIRRYVK